MDSISPQIVLASSSPRRKMLLQQLEIPFEIRVSDIPEDLDPSLPPHQFAEILALQKAQAIAPTFKNTLIIGADTIVVDDRGILGKPRNAEDAYHMLARLSAQVHRVITGVAVVSTRPPQQHLVRHETTEVKITPLSDQDIQWYVNTGEPLDKAGAYAIQGKGSIFVEWIRGCYNNVVGLPLFLLINMLREINGEFHL